MAAFLLLVLATSALAQSTCSRDSKCGSSNPCCSEYGHCGKGSFCMGGCDPWASFSPASCIIEPVCKSTNYTFDDPARLINYTQFNNDADAGDFTLDQGQVVRLSDNSIALTLSESGANAKGTRISSTRSIWYGTVTARIKTTAKVGIVSAMVLMSGLRDEQDWEFTNNTNGLEGQTNYFSLGNPDFTHGGVSTVSSDSSADFHDFTFAWDPSQIQWQIDGKTVRTLKKEDTLNSTTGNYDFPSTPSRLQLAVWPAGVPGVSQGVQEWAGGEIDWTDPAYTAQGYYYMIVDSVSVQCYSSQYANATGYVYSDSTTPGVANVLYSSADTQIYSSKATGSNMDVGKSKSGGNDTAGIINAGQGVRPWLAQTVFAGLLAGLALLI